jgi:hypothetical protein
MEQLDCVEVVAHDVRACRDEGERERRLPAQVLAAMHEATRPPNLLAHYFYL